MGGARDVAGFKGKVVGWNENKKKSHNEGTHASVREEGELNE